MVIMTSLRGIGSTSLVSSLGLRRGLVNRFLFISRLNSLSRPLFLVVDAKVAVFADTLRIQRPVRMLALACLLSPSSSMVTVLTHAVSIV